MPAIDCIGSRMSAATSRPASASSTAPSQPNGTQVVSGKTARYGAWYLSPQVAASAPSVRPWKPSANATTRLRPVTDRASLSAVSLASVPELHQNTRFSPSGARSTSAWAAAARTGL